MSDLDCKICKTSFVTKYNLKAHLVTNKKCLKLRGLELQSNFICKGCKSSFINNTIMTIHMDICKKYITIKTEEICSKKIRLECDQKIKNIEEQCDQKMKNIEEQSKNNTEQYEQKMKNIKEQSKNNERLYKDELNIQLHLKEIEYLKIKSNYEFLEKYNEKTITKLELKISKCDTIFQDMVRDRLYNEDVSDIELEENKDNENNDPEKEYKLKPLDLGNDMYIESREDGYINITNLCNAGGKLFDHWNSLDRTKVYLKELCNDTGIPVSLLVTNKTGLGSNQSTWAHPYVAVNIAQWISPQFDVKISSWIYEVMLTGKIDISKTKSFQQLRLENKDQKIKIQYLTKKYVKLQPRIQYTEQNVIYILTTPSHKKEGRYILGKATNLTSRLSVYNKTDEHEVVYYQSCQDEETMSIIEQFVFQRLKDYREQANRERFVLPEGKTIDLFIDVIKKTIG